MTTKSNNLVVQQVGFEGRIDCSYLYGPDYGFKFFLNIFPDCCAQTVMSRFMINGYTQNSKREWTTGVNSLLTYASKQPTPTKRSLSNLFTHGVGRNYGYNKAVVLTMSDYEGSRQADFVEFLNSFGTDFKPTYACKSDHGAYNVITYTWIRSKPV